MRYKFGLDRATFLLFFAYRLSAITEKTSKETTCVGFSFHSVSTKQLVRLKLGSCMNIGDCSVGCSIHCAEPSRTVDGTTSSSF